MVGVDLVLSSGFLAFAAQAGFLAAVEDVGLEVEGVCGTSSGALAGALWSAGMPAEELFHELCQRTPLAWVTPHLCVWRGLFRLDPVVASLAEQLPERFEDLPHAFGAGVAAGAEAVLLTEGPLVSAVAASCAVPYLFVPVDVGGRTFVDGGAVDRTMLGAWRALRPGRTVVLHFLEPSHGAPGGSEGLADLVVRSPRSGAKLWSLGDARGRFDAARTRTRDLLEAWHGGSADDGGPQRV
jgi:predicted acylesterase/phospholipase RssA